MQRELVSSEGLRIDGRRWNELRHIAMKVGVFRKCDGSAYFEQGNTKVIASVYGPRETTRKGRLGEKGCRINCEYVMAPFSGMDHKKANKRDRRSLEISLLLERSFREVIETRHYPNSQIDMYVNVIAADGGTRCAAINALTLALADAGIPMTDLLVACAAGVVQSKVLLDLNHVEDSAGVDLPVAIAASSEEVVLCQMDNRMAVDRFEELLQVAVAGAKQVSELMKRCLTEYGVRMAAAELHFQNAVIGDAVPDAATTTASKDSAR